MLVLKYVRKLLLKHFLEVRWQTVVFVIAAYFVLSWILLALSGEKDLISLDSYFYWIIVTASTVGYGDLSPTTTAGRYVVSLFVIPLGLSLFGLAIGRIAAFFSFHWRRGVKGLRKLHYENHIVVIGWNGTRTQQLLRLLLRENKFEVTPRNIVLCVRADVENPMPDNIGFVKVDSFNHDNDMERASIETASCIIIDNPEDDLTMTTALYCSGKNPNAHTIAYFSDETLGALLNNHCPNVECMPSVSVEMMAKAAVDPGSSFLHHELLNADKGMTQYSAPFSGADEVNVKSVFLYLKEQFDATLIGVAKEGSQEIAINPRFGEIIYPQDVIFYIADERIQKIDWSGLSVR